MALKLVDDFDGVTEAETVEFSIDGIVYEIDLSEDSKEKMRKDFKRYIDVARRVSGSAKKSAKKVSTARTPSAETTINNDAIRDWAVANGHPVTRRGRIPRDVKEAFEKAHESAGAASMFSAAGAN